MIVGIESGGTKTLCAIADPSDAANPVRVERIATTTPAETFGRINDIIAETLGTQTPDAVGIASFGPLNTNPDDEHYGWITGTTKPGWAFTDVLRHLHTDGAPHAFVTDVTGSAMGEATWGAAHGVERVAYATVGTGIGVGFVAGDHILGGNGFPEMGNILVRRHSRDDFEGSCPFHGDCVEGLASGPSVIARWGASGSELSAPDREAMVEIVGYYVAQLISVVTYTLGAERVVLGGFLATLLEWGYPSLPREIEASTVPAAWEGVSIYPAALGEDRLLIGAAELALAPVLRDPMRIAES